MQMDGTKHMKKLVFTSLMAAGAFALPVAAQAQDTTKPDITIGASVGMHDLGVDLGDLDADDGEFNDFNIDDTAEIYGGFAAIDVPVGESMFAGVEGNFHLGSGPIESEYGVSGRLGFKTKGGSKIYARGGYQWVDLDLGNLTGLDEDFLDENNIDVKDVGGDYLVGVGVEVPVSSVVLRANVDTIAFDTLRGTVGVAIKF
jgi:opacity protein-like surface antigen